MSVDDVDQIVESDLRKRIEDEGDYAADYLEDLLDIAELDGDIEISAEKDRASVAIVLEENTDRRLKRLIGRHGETLDALQELTRLAVQQKTGERSRLMLDILGYRENRRQAIQAIARDAVEHVKETGEDFALKPMNPFERKVVHDVAAAAGLYSDSSGVGPNRHVVIMLPFEDEEDEDFSAPSSSAQTAESSSSAYSSSATSPSADSGDSSESSSSAESAESPESLEFSADCESSMSSDDCDE